MTVKQNLFKSLFVVVCFLAQTVSWTQNNPCQQVTSYKIVVLGSSTAAGAGASVSDSAWVNRYRTYLESINPNNEVLNFGVGGYNTYRIMPTGFVPPSNRPSPDVAKNITAAIAENPDAIIVNMPSNDVAGGYSYAEQMSNFDTIVQIANSNNIPIWICTTQPRNFNNAAQLQLQSDLKDSINSIYSPFTLDFWSTIANPNHTINPTFNSGDGVHLNNAGHALLLQRAIAADLLSAIYTPPSEVDYGIQSIFSNLDSECGDSLTEVQIVVANFGVLDTMPSKLYLKTESSPAGYNTFDSIVFSPISECEVDTLSFTINTYDQADYHLLSYLYSLNDTVAVNDSSIFQITTIGHPTAIPLFDTLCMAGTGLLVHNLQNNDTTFWYENTTTLNSIANGPVFQSPFIDTTTTWYAESVRGDLYYAASIETTTNSNINWNGAMFNLMPQLDLIIDSIGLKINNTGFQNVDIYYKIGSYIGFENSPANWTLLTTASAFVTDSLALTYYQLPALSLNGNDTVGFYVQLSNPQSRLGYQSVSNPITRSNSELSITTGTGVSHNFVGSYFPRDLNCDIRYHFGSRPLGACSTGRFPATIFVSEFEFSLGNDTIIDIDDSLILAVPAGLNNWLWNNSELDSMFFLNGNEVGTGIHFVELAGYDSLGCTISDEIIIGVANLVGLTENTALAINVFPNPATNWVNSDIETSEIVIFNSQGQSIQFANKFPLNIAHLSQGTYLIKTISKNGEVNFSKLIKQ